jgi:UMF1 family MFS transporter
MKNNMDRSIQRAEWKKMRATRRERWSWYMYDFGNSAYAAVVLLAVYSAYFKQQVVGGAEGSRMWGISIGIAMLVVAILSPLLGALADYSSTKKRMLAIFSALACVFTAMLFFVQQGDVFTGMLFFILAEIGYRSGQVFYNALLPEIATSEEMGRVSGTGWAVGSAGGIVCLVIVLALILGIKGTFMIRTAFLITAAFYLLSTLPIFLFLRERTQPRPLPKGTTYFTLSVKRLVTTFKNARAYKSFMNFLVAFLVFNNGIMIALDFAAIIGAVLFGLTQQQLIIFMIIVQVTSVLGAFLFGKFYDRIGGRTTMIISLLAMLFTVALLFVVKSLTIFYVIGGLAGFALTAVQVSSRTTVGHMAPEEQATEFYGLFSLASQVSNFIGPTLYGIIVVWLTNFYANRGLEAIPAEQSGQRLAVSMIILFLLAGLFLVLRVKEWRRVEKAVVVK